MSISSTFQLWNPRPLRFSERTTHGYTLSLFSLFPRERPASVSQGLGTKVALLLLDLALTVDSVSLALALQQPWASSKSQFLPPLPPRHFHTEVEVSTKMGIPEQAPGVAASSGGEQREPGV